jgi:hypothetical protein
LPQQVPGLVESGPDLPETLFLLGSYARADVSFLELALLGYKLRDALVQLSVFHRVSILPIAGRDVEPPTGETVQLRRLTRVS